MSQPQRRVPPIVPRKGQERADARGMIIGPNLQIIPQP